MKKYNIHHYSSENDDIKASVVERYNRTIKQRMFRYFTANHTRRYIDVLPDLIHSYNHTFHPSQVGAHNEEVVRKRLYPDKKSSEKNRWKFDVGQTVRIIMRRTPFQKAYEEGRWSREVFVIHKRLPTTPVTYSLVDLDGETIKGKWYTEELQKVRKPDDDALFNVERVLKSRKRPDGRIEHLVQWEGYPTKFNSWTTDLTKR